MAIPATTSALRPIDLGTVYTLSATGITTSYQSSNAIAAGALGGWFRFSLKSTTIVTTNITAVVMNIQASKNGALWESVAASDEAGSNPFATDQSFSIAAAGTAQVNSVHVGPGYKLLRVQLKATGGAGQALESLAVDCVSYLA